MEETRDCLFSSYKAVAEVFRNTSDDVFQQKNPLTGRLGELFPTIGSMHNFYVGGHMMIHMGQMSAWRRMEGLGAA